MAIGAANASRRAQLASSLTAQETKKKGDGFLGAGFGPDFGPNVVPDLGVVRAGKEFGLGLLAIPGMAYSLAPGGRKSQLPQFAKGFTSSLVGTASTALTPLQIPGTKFNASNALETIGAEALGEEFRPKDIFERIKERGLTSAVVEDIGNIGIYGAAAKGAVGSAARNATRAAEAASAAGDTARAAEFAQRASSLSQTAARLDKVAHPYQTMAQGIGDLTGAARAKIFPGEATVPPAAASAADQVASEVQAADEAAHVARTEAGGGTQQTFEDAWAAELSALANPQVAAADNLTPLQQAALEAERGVEAANAAEDAAVAARHKALLDQAGEPTRKLYRGESRLEQQGGSTYADTYEEALTHAGGDASKVYEVEVPESVAKRAQELGKAEGHMGAKGEGAYLLEGEWGNYRKLSKEKPLTEGQQTIKNAVDEAQAKVEPINAETREAARVARPASPGIQRIVDALPDSVNRVLAHLNTPISTYNARVLRRNYERYVEVAQRGARSSEGVQASLEGARVVMEAIPGMDRATASQMIGQELGKRLDGTAFYEEALKGPGVSKATAEILRQKATRGMGGITDEVWAAMDDTQKAAVEQALGTAAEAWRADSTARLNTLLQSRHGARGLEAAVLGSDAPIMSPSQLKRYRTAMSLLRREEKLRTRAVEDGLRAEANAARARHLSDFAGQEAARFREKVGDAERARADLVRARPKALDGAARTEATVQELFDAAAEGTTYNVGTGVVDFAPTGAAVAVRGLFDVPVEEFAANGHQLIKDALIHNTEEWSNPHARFGIYTDIAADGTPHVMADISISTFKGAKGKTEPLKLWQGEIVGEGFQQLSIYDIDGERVHELPQNPTRQDLSANYIEMALDSNSPFYRVYNEMEAAAEQVPGLTREDVSDMMHAWMTWDYQLSRTNPEHALGDSFKEFKVDVGKRTPTREEALFQTILNYGTPDAVDRAIKSLAPQEVNDAMKWYYDSHDYIEQMYRGKTMKLLNGQERDMADVMYDLLAVTSVMASPKQNLGRALMGLANMEEFLAGQKNGLKAAEALVARMQKLPGEFTYVDDAGREIDRAAQRPGARTAGTRVSRKFFDIPEVRAITNQTSMVTAPKYNVFDILSGRLNLSTATTADIAKLPEYWMGEGTAKSLSSQNVPRSNVVQQLDNAGQRADAYRAWQKEYDTIKELRQRVKEDPAALAESGFPSKAAMERAWSEIKMREQEILDADPEAAAAFDRATMEHKGSAALAKLRSFRDNLANPEESMAVTLDSVMGRLYGMKNTDWGIAGNYATRAREIREAAETLSQRLGREVKPHEVQALLWVFAKKEVGRQDWGRMLSHHDLAQGKLEQIAKRARAGEDVSAAIESFDPYGEFWNEELSYSREAAEGRQDRARLRKEKKRRGKLSPDDQARLDELEAADFNEIRQEDIMTTADRGDMAVPEDAAAYEFETRRSIPYDMKKLAAKEEQYNTYLQTADEIKQAMRDGDFERASKLMSEYALDRKRSLQGDTGGSFQVVGEETRRSVNDSAAVAERMLKDSKFIPAPNEWPGSLNELHQKFNETVRGATLFPKGDKTGPLIMRLFADADPTTLMHESGHLVRQILGDKLGEAMIRKYPGITDETLTPARVAAEEAFAADLEHYIRTRQSPAQLGDSFEKIAAVMEDQYAAMLDTPIGRTLDPEIVNFWDGLFNPDIVRPDKMFDPLSLNTVRIGADAVETKRFHWESDAEFARRARQYGEARERVRTAQFKARLKERVATTADAAATKLELLMRAPTRAAELADRAGMKASAIFDQLAAELDNPNISAVPANWQPMYKAMKDLQEEAKNDPTGQIAAAMAEIPENFSEMLRFAAKRGFEPTQLPEMSWGKAQNLLFGHVTLGKYGRELESVEAGQRKLRTGKLAEIGGVDRSIEALAAGAIEATHELYSNRLVGFIEDNYARPLPKGATIPQGWSAWSPEKSYILTGEKLVNKEVIEFAGQEAMIVPTPVKLALEEMSKQYDHRLFRGITKLTSPWRAFLLTFSPKWYVNNFIGNMIMATAEGVKLRDWTNAYKQFKSSNLPKEVAGHSYVSTLVEDTASNSLVQRGVRDTVANEGVRAGTREFTHRLRRMNESFDEIARAAVFEKTLRTSGSRSKALERAYEAMVDYGNLGPFERAAVRAAIPFYAWQKGILKLVARFPADHPIAFPILLQLGQMHLENLEDQLGGPVPDAYLGLTNLFGHDVSLRGFDPYLDAAALTSPEGIAASLNPFVDIVARDAFNAPEGGYADQYKLDATGHAVPDVNVPSELAQVGLGLPVSRLAGQEVLGGDLYRQDPGVLGGFARFAGVPRAYTPEEIAKIQERLAKAQETTSGQTQTITVPRK